MECSMRLLRHPDFIASSPFRKDQEVELGRESAQRYRYRLDEVMAPATRWTPCRCPMCHKHWSKKMNWTGGGGPLAPFNCPSCDGIRSRIETWCSL